MTWNELAGFQYLQIHPESDAAEVPLVIALHGRGSDPLDLAGLAFDLPPGYRWILPRAPIPLQIPDGRTGWAWYSIGSRLAGSVPDPERAVSVVTARAQVAGFVDELLDRLRTPRDRTILLGFSQGASMSLHVGLASPEPFASIISMSGYLPAPETLTGTGAGPPRSILVIHGLYDRALPIDLAREAKAWLEASGYSPRYFEISMDHQISYESLGIVHEYLLEILPPPGGEHPSPPGEGFAW